MTKGKNRFTGQEKAGHKPILCDKCRQPGGIKGSPPLRKRQDGTYVHQRSCPRPIPKTIRGANIKLPTNEEIAKIQATKSPDERMA